MLARIKLHYRGLLAVLLLGLLAAGGYLLPSKSVPAARLPVRIGIPLQLPSSLLMIAQQQGLFAAEGLEVELHRYPSGIRALTEGLLPGQDDFVSAADVPFVFHSFTQPELTAVSAISLNINDFRILARRDHGVNRLSDLQGKTIAVQANSATHYFVHGVEEVEGLRTLRTVYAPIERLGSGLLAGDYDAISIREPYLQQIATQLGDKAVILAEPGSYVQHELLLTKSGYLRQHPAVAERLLRALYQAEQLRASQPKLAAALVSGFMGATVQADISTEYELVLPQAMLFMLDAQAQWMHNEHLVSSATLPDFLQHIDTAPFRHVLPNRATLIE